MANKANTPTCNTSSLASRFSFSTLLHVLVLFFMAVAVGVFYFTVLLIGGAPARAAANHMATLLWLSPLCVSVFVRSRR
jgi:hypothetical protein